MEVEKHCLNLVFVVVFDRGEGEEEEVVTMVGWGDLTKGLVVDVKTPMAVAALVVGEAR
jgi:hypothetical protein